VGDQEYRRFSEFVRVQARAKPFIAHAEEWSLLHEGLRHFGVQAEEGRWIVLGVAADEGVGVETQLDDRIGTVLAHFAGRDGKLSRHEFETAVAIYRRWGKDGLGADEIRGKLKKMVEASNWKPKRRGALRSIRWFRKVRTD